jgi:hypothetical protein
MPDDKSPVELEPGVLALGAVYAASLLGLILFLAL